MKKAKIQRVNLPVPLTNSDKADLAEALVDLRVDKQSLDEKKAEFLKQHKEELAEVENKIDYQFNLLKAGTKNKEVDARIRKNFDAEPPCIEYVDSKKDDKILHTIPMQAEDYQLEAEDWVVGEVKPIPETETWPEDLKDVEEADLDEEDVDDE